MKKNFYLSLILLFTNLISNANASDIEYGDNFIVFEAESATFSTTYWKLLTPADANYQKYVTATNNSGIHPINNTYLQYIGPWQGDGENSKISYTFTCKSTGDYQLAARLHQPLEEGEKGDAKNDVYVKMEGNFTSASKFTTEDLTLKHKFWGRGVNQWGTCQYLEHNGSDFPVYHFTEGEEYTLSLYGRSAGTCIDYFIFFKTELRLGVGNTDFAQQNPELYRPGGPETLLDNVAKIMFDKSSTYITKPGDTKQLIYHVFPTTAIDKSVTWTSSNEDIVTVNQEGVMTAIANGQATITATTTDGNLQAVNEMEVGKIIETFDDYLSYNGNRMDYSGDNGFSWITRGLTAYRMNKTNAIQYSGGVTGIRGVNIPGGIKSFSIQCRHLYTLDQAREISLLINGTEVGKSSLISSKEYEFTVDNINIDGTFSLELKLNDGSKIVMFDNLTWTPMKPEDVVINNSISLNKAIELTTYPNPVKSGIITVNNIEPGMYNTSVYSVTGSLILNYLLNIGHESQTSLNVNDLNSGVYFLVMESDDNLYKSRFIVSK